MNFIREKRCTCRNGYTETDIYQISDSSTHRLQRAKRERATLPKQKKLNDERSRRVCRLVINDNFVQGDFFVTLSYADNMLPTDTRAAYYDLVNFIRKLRRIYSKLSQPLRYLYVIELGELHGRVHHHVLINNIGISRDMIEELWAMGRANCDRLKPDPDGTFNCVADYMMKSAGTAEKYARTWNCSRNMHRPEECINDNRVSTKQLQTLLVANRNDELKAVAAKLYLVNEADILDVHAGVCEVTGLMYVKMRYIRRKYERSKSKCVRDFRRKQGHSKNETNNSRLKTCRNQR